MAAVLGPGGPIVATAVGSARDGCSLSASASRDYSAGWSKWSTAGCLVTSRTSSCDHAKILA